MFQCAVAHQNADGGPLAAAPAGPANEMADSATAAAGDDEEDEQVLAQVHPVKELKKYVPQDGSDDLLLPHRSAQPASGHLSALLSMQHCALLAMADVLPDA